MRKITILAVVATFPLLLHAQGLKDLMPEGKYIGTAINNAYLAGSGNSEGYNETFIKDFNCVVAENAFKMAYVIPDRPADPFNLTIDDLSASQLALIDAMIDTAQKYNMRTRGHAYIWHSQAPSWLTSEAPGWTSQQIYDFAESYITVFGTYCKGRIDEWDVVNEALNDNGQGFRQGTWYDNVDDKQTFIEHCFTVANPVDPDAELFYNDYSIGLYKFNAGSIGNSKNGPMLQMVNNMLDHGAPIHGVGLQSHYISGSSMTDSTYIALEKTFDTLNTLGMICNLTELDIRICGGTSEADLVKQGDEYKRITELFLSKENGVALLVWGITDESSWIPGTFNGCDDPLLYDRSMKPKLAYYGVKQAAMEATGVYTGPYNYIPATVPGIVEAENYDYDEYADNDAGNTGGVYRTDSVDIAEANTGYVVGWTEAGEYLSYTLEVEVSDTFDIDFVYASEIAPDTFAEIELLVDGVALAENILLPTTESLDDYDTLSIDSVWLPQGFHKVRLNFISGGAYIDYMDFSRVDCYGTRNGTAFIDQCDECVGGETGLEACIIRNPFTAMTIPGIVEAENYDEGDNGVTYFDNTPGNEGGAYRNDDADIATGADPDEVFLGWIESGEWWEYTLTIAETGNYDVTIRAASELTTGALSIQANGETVLSSRSIPNTGGWTTFQEIQAGTVSLEAGEAVIRVNATGSYFNLDYIEFEVAAELSLEQATGSSLVVKPNPFTSYIEIEGLESNQEWSLYATDGKLMKKGSADRIETHDLQPGMYILRTENQNIKLIKM